MTFNSGTSGISGSFGSNSQNNLFNTPVNNAGLAPLQGFDADVWVLDQGTGSYNLVGRFTSIQVTIRNATEPYLELNQRVPMLLDGEFQFGWVLERGMLDTRILEQTFGYSSITRELRNNRNTRFQISFSVAAPELQQAGRTILNDTSLTNGQRVSGGSSPFAERKAVGEYVLTFCRVDSLTIGVNSGRNVIANRWEGMCEGIEFVDRNIVEVGAFLDSTRADDALNAANLNNTNTPFNWDNILIRDNPLNTDSGGVQGPVPIDVLSGQLQAPTE